VTTGFIDGLPKAELHVHLEGTLEPNLLFAIARRNQLPVAWESVEELRAAYQFTGLEHFLPLLFAGCRVFRTQDDFYDLALAYLQKASSQQVRRVELFFGAQTFLDLGIPIADQLGHSAGQYVVAAAAVEHSHVVPALQRIPHLVRTSQTGAAQNEHVERFCGGLTKWSDPRAQRECAARERGVANKISTMSHGEGG